MGWRRCRTPPCRRRPTPADAAWLPRSRCHRHYKGYDKKYLVLVRSKKLVTLCTNNDFFSVPDFPFLGDGNVLAMTFLLELQLLLILLLAHHTDQELGAGIGFVDYQLFLGSLF